jgi:hypothetical protein
MRYRIRRIDRNRGEQRFGNKSKRASKKKIAQLLVPGDRFGTGARPPSLLYLKITFIQEVKSRLCASVIKEGTASGKHKEYRSPCIACPRLAFARVARRTTYMNNLIPDAAPNSFQ